MSITNQINYVGIFVDGKKAKTELLNKLFLPEKRLAAFESLKCYRGVVFRLEQHLNRLFESAKTIGLRIGKTRRELAGEIKKCGAHFADDDYFFRLTVDERHSYLIVVRRKRPVTVYQQGVSLKTAVVRRYGINASPPEAKTSDFVNGLSAVLDSKGENVFDVVLLDAKGYLTESVIWNIFIVKDGILLTPQTGILNGVTRQFVIECAAKENMIVSEINLTRHDMWNAEEAFLTNTSGEIVPIHSLDGRKIGNKIPGFITKKLIKRFQQELAKELRKK